MQRIRRLAASTGRTGGGSEITASRNYNICGTARRARASGRSRSTIEAVCLRLTFGGFGGKLKAARDANEESGADSMADTAITIILPVKDYVPRYLKAAVQSVLDQSSDDWRLVLAADRSVAAELESFRRASCPIQGFN